MLPAGRRFPAPLWKHKAPNLHKINGFGKYNRGKNRIGGNRLKRLTRRGPKPEDSPLNPASYLLESGGGKPAPSLIRKEKVAA